jgi:ABC-type dipeptide/oligopeptide/nickel transport system permease component
MTPFLIRRVLQAGLVLFGSTLVVFVLVRLSGDPAQLMLGMNATAEDLVRFRQQQGLNDPLWVQYWRFISGAVQGDFGRSIQQGQPALGLVLDRLPATTELAFAALAVSLGAAIPLGILAARWRGRLLDRAVIGAASVAQAMPPYWLGLLLILVFAVGLHWFPTQGRGSFSSLVLPTVTLALFFMARTTRLMRSSMLEVLGQDYLRTARAKGLPEAVILRRHAFKNAAIAVITVAGVDLSVLMGGAVITETVFAWPGLGRLVISSIFNRDYPVVQAAVFVVAVVVVLTNLLIDLVYLYLDPRIRYQ